MVEVFMICLFLVRDASTPNVFPRPARRHGPPGPDRGLHGTGRGRRARRLRGRRPDRVGRRDPETRTRLGPVARAVPHRADCSVAVVPHA
ncbi:hypothetical protein ABZZ47_24040 [Streptomyces sp. NPDC006465]|uniref:hypothetical protein n=1 Tax=Streptomyces sp. NPDC006465 TaxID=3157174 RepID=UPI0033A83292